MPSLPGPEFLHECMPARAQVPGDQLRAGPLHVRCVDSEPLGDLRELGRELSPAMASHCRRCPFSYQTARQRAPSRRAEHTVIPLVQLDHTRPSPRVAARPVPLTKAGRRAVRSWRVLAAAGPVTPERDGCGFSVGILARVGRCLRHGLPLLLRFAQVKG
jgi:hypothetical protein